MTQQPERFDALTAALARTTARHTATSSIDPERATDTDLLVALTAIADELRTANLLTAARLLELTDVGGESRVQALQRLGFPDPPRTIGPS
jgi:hypothetical protein